MLNESNTDRDQAWSMTSFTRISSLPAVKSITLLWATVFSCGLLAEDTGDRHRRISHRHDVSSTNHQQLGVNSGAYASGDNYPDFSPVGALLAKDNGWMGTATLISPGCILTAAHVVWDNASLPEPNPANWEFVLGTDFESASAKKYNVASIHVHPGWVACLANNDGDLKGFDIALLQLSSSVQGQSPAIVNASFKEITGEILYFAGVGALANGIDGPTNPSNSSRFAGANVLDRVSPEVSHELSSSLYSGSKGGVLGFDFDSPSGDKNSLSGEITYGRLGSGTSDPTPISMEATSSSGDSGGPAFSWLGDAWRVVGVSSYGTTNSVYGDVAVYTRVANHADWIFTYLDSWSTAAWAGSGTWRTSSWFGSFSVTTDGKWIYHEKHGWLYAPGGGDNLDDLWFWSEDLGWTWTNHKTYPYFYQAKTATTGNWLYFWDSYSPVGGTRYFYDFSTESLITWE